MAQTVNALSAASPAAQNLYGSLLAALRRLGPFQEEPKKTSVHLVRKSAFAGVQLRRDCLILTIKSDKRIRSSRIKKGEQVSKNRWHSEVKIEGESDLDGELMGWLRAAYELCA